MESIDVYTLFSIRNAIKIFCTAAGLFIISYLWKVKKAYNFFKERGIQTPKYSFFFGNHKEILKTKSFSEVLGRWTKQFGKLYGFYEGHQPVLVTTDLKFIEEVFIKQFSNFAARKRARLAPNENSKFLNLFFATKSRWKRLRTIMNPTFSTSKLREINGHIIKCADRLVDKLNENVKTEINMSTFLKRFTMDTIWNVAFGIDTDMQNNMDNQYFYKAEEAFSGSGEFGFLLKIATYFHEIRGYLMHALIYFGDLIGLFDQNKMPPYAWVLKRIVEVVDLRKQDVLAKNKRDYLQLLLEAQSSDASSSCFHNAGDKSVDFSKMHNEKKMSTDEVKLNLVLFLLAGYETTSTVLSYIFYVLAKYPEEQQKVFEEINEFFSIDLMIEPNVDNIQTLEYTDMFIKEVMRVYPIGNALGRECTNSTTVCGVDIPEKTAVIVDSLTVLNDTDIWGEDANEFNPMRFSPEIKRSPVAYMAFGIGPKNCIGMKFALLEIKVALVKLLTKFQVHKCSKTVEKLQFTEGIVRGPVGGIDLLFTKR